MYPVNIQNPPISHPPTSSNNPSVPGGCDLTRYLSSSDLNTFSGPIYKLRFIELLIKNNTDDACRTNLERVLNSQEFDSLLKSHTQHCIELLFENGTDSACKDALEKILSSLNLSELPTNYHVISCMEFLFEKKEDPTYGATCEAALIRNLNSLELNKLLDDQEVNREIEYLRFLIKHGDYSPCETALNRILNSLDVSELQDPRRLEYLKFLFANKANPACELASNNILASLELNRPPAHQIIQYIKFLFNNREEGGLAYETALNNLLASVELSELPNVHQPVYIEILFENRKYPRSRMTLEKILNSLELNATLDYQKIKYLNFLFKNRTDLTCKTVLEKTLNSLEFNKLPDNYKIEYITLLIKNRTDSACEEALVRTLNSLNLNELRVHLGTRCIEILYENKEDLVCKTALAKILDLNNLTYHRAIEYINFLLKNKTDPICEMALNNALNSLNSNGIQIIQNVLDDLDNFLDSFYMFIAENISSGNLTNPNIHKLFTRWLLRNNDQILGREVYEQLRSAIKAGRIVDAEANLIQLIEENCEKTLHEGLGTPSGSEEVLPRLLSFMNQLMRESRQAVKLGGCCANAAMSCAYVANKIPISHEKARRIAAGNLRSPKSRLNMLGEDFEIQEINLENSQSFDDIRDDLENRGLLRHGVLVAYRSTTTQTGHLEFVYKYERKLWFSTSNLVRMTGDDILFAYRFRTPTPCNQAKSYWDKPHQTIESIWALTPKNRSLA